MEFLEYEKKSFIIFLYKFSLIVQYDKKKH